MHVAVESPCVGVAPEESKHAGIVEVLVHAVAVPHLHVLLTQVLEIDESQPTAVATVVPHKHWHMPKLDIAVNPVAHVTPEHGSEKGPLPNL